MLSWEDGTQQELPFVWLRDNDPSELHPDTKERTFDLASVPLDIQPRSYSIEANALKMRWPERNNDSIYTSEWLNEHRLGRPAEDPAKLEQQSWFPSDMQTMYRFDAKDSENKKGLLKVLTAMKRYGLVLIDNLQDDPQAGERFGDLIGFKRESNFGVIFDVISKPDPNNLAYTSIALPLHTDLPNQELVPGFQFLHCYKNNTIGGASVLADGLAIVEEFKRDFPEHFALLSELDVPFRFHDETCDIRRKRPIIDIDADGNLRNFTFNGHIADVACLPADKIYDFYAAYHTLMKRIRSDDYSIRYTLQPGEMVIFDNRRVMHGRDSFDPTAGDRHLRGYYIDHNEVDSRLRVLAR
jgi:gamma-butyrobetaine dioxygenase